MRASDIARLSTPYKGDVNTPSPGPSAALGVDVPMWEQLARTIFSDLTTHPPYGIGWWDPHPGTSWRILISDQLYACTESVSTNMIEAALHWLEFVDSADRHSDRFVHAVRFENRMPIFNPPRPQNPLEELSIQMVRLHVAGVVRALAGALDCMAGTIIGVLALPRSILKADFGQVRELLKKKVANKSTESERVQASFAEEFERLIGIAGPAEWLDWELAFRNMLVHRGRRIDVGQYVPKTPVLYGPGSQPIPRVRVVNHLPRDPGRSDVEVFLEPSRTLVLTEDADQTLNGLLNSTRLLIQGAAKELIKVWNWRRHSRSLPQPAEQWPSGASTDSIGFCGYAPGSFEYGPDMMLTHPIVAQRISAAALDDLARPQWRTFD